MGSRIEDYALLGDTQTAALVSREGSIDWLCLPRFDGSACFAALLGDPDHGRWLLAPRGAVRSVERRYRGETLVLETDYETASGAITVIDTMPPPPERGAESCVTIVRIVAGRHGRVPVQTELAVRFGYGLVAPLLRRVNGDLLADCGPDALRLATTVDLDIDDRAARAVFTVGEGERVPFALTWYRSHLPPPPYRNTEELLAASERWWREWAARCTYEGEWCGPVLRSLLTLKALTYAPTGGMVAAATTSLPEQLGGTRNWDYRYCWVRDAAFTITALHQSGYREEALAWRSWLLRAVAGDPAHARIVYGPAGERHLPEWEADWLPGYERSEPVRIGNAAADQFQLDIFGEVADSLYTLALECGLDQSQPPLIARVLRHLEQVWTQPDDGIWEVRGGRRHFTYSKVMAWVAFDRAIQLIERGHMDGPADRWRTTRDQIHAEICEHGFDRDQQSFVQCYGSRDLDASLLRLAHVGFLPPDDPRIGGTIEAIVNRLSVDDGLVLRYSRDAQGAVDGIPEGEGAFLACAFWLADNLALVGRQDEARALFERLLSLRNDVGLLAEEYDPQSGRHLGNFPQAYSHVALVNTALLLSGQREGRRDT
jgi:GH15 family glucan-1,4-alpha-glucosidase